MDSTLLRVNLCSLGKFCELRKQILYNKEIIKIGSQMGILPKIQRKSIKIVDNLNLETDACLEILVSGLVRQDSNKDDENLTKSGETYQNLRHS